MKKRQGILIILGMVLLPGMGRGQDSLNVSMVSSLNIDWDITEGIAIYENYAYIANVNDGIRIIDISDSTNPATIGIFRPAATNWKAYNIDIIDHFAYILGSSSFLAADISDPLNPLEISSAMIPILNNPYKNILNISGDYAYIGQHSTFQIINIENPANIFTESQLTLDTTITDIAVSENYVYLTLTHDGLIIVDVSHPNNPIILGSNNYIGRLAVSDTMLYFVNDYSYLTTVNISNPINPIVYDSFFLDFNGDVNQISLTGNYLYIASSDNGLLIEDISNPNDVNEVGHYNGINDIYSFLLVNNIIYIGDIKSNLRILDNTNIFQPLEIGNLFTPHAFASGLVFQDEYAYIAGYAGNVLIIDISDILNPIIVGGCYPLDYAINIDVSGNYAYLADNSAGITIIDVGNPSNPFIIGNCSISGNISDLSVQDDYTYTIDSTPGYFSIINTSNPANPFLVGQTSIIAQNDLFVSGNYAYVGSNYVSFSVIDISSPSNPFIVYSNSSLFGPVETLIVEGNMAYLVAESKLYTADISNINNMVILGQCDLLSVNPVPKCDLVKYEDNIYIAREDLTIVNVADSVNPYIAGYYDLPGSCTLNDIVVVGDYALCTHYDILYTFDCSHAVSSVRPAISQSPSSFSLLHPSPNPFNNSTTISFNLAKAGEVKLAVYDLLGREIQALGTGHWALGTNSVVWDAKDCGSGVYFIQLTVDSGQSTVKKVVLMK